MYDIVVDTLVITLYSFFQNQLFLLQWCSLFIVTKFPALSLSLSLSRTRLETLASLSLTSFWKKKWICVCNYGSFWSCFVDWNRVYEIMRLNCVCASDLVWFCFECVNLECFFLLSLEDSSVWGRRIVFDSWSVFVFLCIRVSLNMKHGHRTLTLVIIWKKWIYWM